MGKSQDAIVNHSPFMAKDLSYLFDTYYSRLCFFAHKMISDRQSSEDVVQDVFMRFWKNQQSFENENAIKSYLYLSVRNACLNLQRHKEVERKYAADSENNTPINEMALENIIKAEVLGEIYLAIEQLPQGCRQVLKLAYFENLKNEEIAQSLGISINTVKTQKQRALQLLRVKLDPTAFLLLLLFIK